MSRWIDIDDYRNCYIGNDGEYERWNIDPNVLDEAKPIIESERKKGKWKVTPLYIKCSECGESFMLIPQNFCPNCGAEMRGEENG